ncbi:MAG: hypothetical protein ACOY3Z_10825 [Thermodesulfobacteriota bacterium]
MNKDILRFGDTEIEISRIDNIIFIQVFGCYTDEMALGLIQRVGQLIDAIPESSIRIWDGTGIPEEGYLLSSGCIDRVARWAEAIEAKKPGSTAYMIIPSLVSFGMSRMYALRADLEGSGVVVLRAVEELPQEIREKLSLSGIMARSTIRKGGSP